MKIQLRIHVVMLILQKKMTVYNYMCSTAVLHHLFKLPLTSSGDPLKGKVKKSLPRSLGITTAGALQKNLHRRSFSLREEKITVHS